MNAAASSSPRDGAPLRVGIFPYNPGYNPYQRLYTDALEAAGATVTRIEPRKVLPVHHALAFNADVLHLDWPHDLYLGRTPALQFAKRLMYGWGLRRLREQPLVWTAHNLVGHDSDDSPYERQMIQRLIDRCDGIVSFSNSAEAALRDQYDIPPTAEAAVIHHGHYIDAYPNDLSPEQARAALDLPADAVVVLGFGTFAEYKGFDALIEAFRAIGRRDAVLLLAGTPKDPDLTSRLSAMAAACRENQALDVRVIAKTIAPDEVQLYFNACDIVGLPFRSILNSGSLLLAMSFGRCIIAPSIGSVPEIAYPAGHFGYDPEDPKGLQASLEKAMTAPDLLERGRNAMRFAQDSYSWSNTAREALSLYGKILAAGRQSP